MGPREERRGRSLRDERALTEGNIIDDKKSKNITGLSQYRFQQTANKSDNEDNYEYFESKYIVKTGGKDKSLTIHRRRGETSTGETSQAKKDNRSSSYNKTTTMVMLLNILKILLLFKQEIIYQELVLLLNILKRQQHMKIKEETKIIIEVLELDQLMNLKNIHKEMLKELVIQLKLKL